jgi:hypothetical protein
MERHFVPCGKCARCELKKRKDWSFRMHQESKYHRYAYFCLITYDEPNALWLNTDTGELKRGYQLQNEDLGQRYSRIVSKRDIQKFIKKLRRSQDYWSKAKGFPCTQIRYYIVSEYGEVSTERPHYHAVIWGMHPYIREKLINNQIWKLGFVTARPLNTNTPQGFMYLTKYLYKQQRLNKFPVKPFSLMSSQPFIGHQFLKAARHYVHNAKSLLLPDGTKIPRAYTKRLSPVNVKLARDNDYKEWSKKEETMIAKCQKLGRKPHGLVQLEKMNFYQEKYNKELIYLNQK